MKILYIQPGLGIGGSKISLSQILHYSPIGQISHVVLDKPPDLVYEQSLSGFVKKIHYLNLPTWNQFSRKSYWEILKTPFSHARRLLSLLPAIQKLINIIQTEQIDLVHTNNAISPAGAFSAYFANVPHVWHVREPIGKEGQYPLIIGDRFTGELFQRLSQKIICNSEFTASYFRKRNIPVQIIRNGIDVKIFQSDDARTRGLHLKRSLLGDFDGPVVAMVGNLTTRWKQHGLFLNVAAGLASRFPYCRFIVFGSSSNLELTSYTRELKKVFEKLNLQDRLTWADFTEDIPAMMHSLDILVHPVSREGSGRVVMEAMASGKPVIGVKSGGVQELIWDTVTGFLVHPLEQDAMMEKIEFLLGNDHERSLMGMQASEFACAHFSNETMVDAIGKIYKELVKDDAGFIL